jgi:CIC family chloride channel protein
LLLVVRQWFLRLPVKTRWWHPVVGGVLVGGMGYFVPQVLGVGYTYVGSALNGTLALKVMLLLIVLKLVGVAVSYATGNAGGIFGPALLLGSMLGGSIGTIAHHYLPAYTASPGAYALVGMGALFAGIVRAPMTSVLMIFEMTRDYAVIVPLMIANMTSLFIASRLQKDPIYEALAHQDGIQLPTVQERSEIGKRTVAQVMEHSPFVLSPKMTVAEALEQMNGGGLFGRASGLSGRRVWPVGDEVRGQTRFLGIVTRESVEAVAEEGGETRLLLNLVKTVNVPRAHSDQPVYLALERMSQANMDILPVVHRADMALLEGVVSMADVLEAYGVPTSVPG